MTLRMKATLLVSVNMSLAAALLKLKYHQPSFVLVLIVGGGLSVVCHILLQAAARRADRSHCSRCGYSLLGLKGSYCPECGHMFARLANED